MSESEETVVSASHVYPAVHASGNATVHLGDQYIIKQDLNDQALEQITNALQFPEIFERHEIIEEHHGSTCEWVLRPATKHKQGRAPKWDCFTTWLTCSEQIYWISGKPGSGKSTLMRYLVDSLSHSSHLTTRSSIVLSFWFWEAGNELQRSFKGCLRSLLYQLLKHPSSVKLVRDSLHELAFSTQIWTEKRLLEVLRGIIEALQAQGMSLLVFLDGVDESVSESGKILKEVEGLVAGFTCLKVCLSSRTERRFIDSLLLYSKLRLQDLNENGIDEIIKVDFLHLASVQRTLADNDRLIEGLKESLKEKAQGVIIWIKLATRSLTDGITNRDSFDALQARLDDLPEDLEDFYSLMISRHHKDVRKYREDAALYFKLILRGTMSLARFCLAINKASTDSFLDTPFRWSKIDIRTALNHENVMVWISVKSGGLLEVSKQSSFHRFVPYKQPETGEQALLAHTDSLRINLIYRTARTFLVDTSKGLDLLSACLYTADDINKVFFDSYLVTNCIIPGLVWKDVDIRLLSEFRAYPPSQALGDKMEKVLNELIAMECLPTFVDALADLSLFESFPVCGNDLGANVDMVNVCCRFLWYEQLSQRLETSYVYNEPKSLSKALWRLI